MGELGDGPVSISDERGYGGCAQSRRGVGENRPADREVVQETLGIGGGQPVAGGGRQAIATVRQTEKLGEGVIGVGAYAHRVRLGGSLPPRDGGPGPGL